MMVHQDGSRHEWVIVTCFLELGPVGRGRSGLIGA